MGGQLSARPYSTAPTKRAMANLAIDRNGMPFYHDAARRVATFFEKWNCLIETYLRARGERIPIKDCPLRAFRRGLPFGIRGLKPILPFLRGRSDAACRVVIRPSWPHLRRPYGFYHDAARRVATSFEKWDCLIETYLRTRRENPPRRLNLYGPFAAVSLLEYGGLNPILPVLRRT